MKCVVCKEPNMLVMNEVDVPTVKPGEALIRIRRVGVCGTDIHAFRGNQPYFTYPRVLGHELAGVIEQIGENSAQLQVGDTVSVIPYLHCGVCVACRSGKLNCCTDLKVLGVHVDGGMCELISVPVEHLMKTPDLSLDQAAVLEPLSIGAHAVRRANLQQGEAVLVIGAGPIGLGVMAFAKRQGARVIAMDINEERLAFCRRWAAVDATVNASSAPSEQIASLTNGDYPMVVFDATGNAQSMGGAIQYVAHGGRLIYVGLVKGDIRIADPEFHKRELTLLSSRNATRADFEVVMQAVIDGGIDTERYITHRAGGDQLTAEFAGWTQPEAGVIKALVEF